MSKMFNRALHFITNRKGDFESPYFPDSKDFSPGIEDGAASEIRKLLSLDSWFNDHGIRAVLAAVHGTPVVFAEFQDSKQTYRVSDFSPTPLSVIGASWVNDENGIPVFRPKQKSLPLPNLLTIAHRTGNRARITYGLDSYDVGVRVVDSFVYPVWPQELGVSGGLKLTGTWSPGYEVKVLGHAPGYPWALVAQQLQSLPACHTVLLQSGFVSQFHQATSPVEKIAIIALALSSLHPDFHG